MLREMVSDLKSVSGTGSPPQVNHFYNVDGHELPMFGRRPLPRSWVILLTERQNDKMTDHIMLRQPWRSNKGFTDQMLLKLSSEKTGDAMYKTFCISEVKFALPDRLR